MVALLEALRPRQWTKNLILFAPLLFALRLGEPRQLLRTCAAFAIFCLLSGAVYLLNDLLDYEQDRRHPIKSSRPLASGRLSRSAAVAALVVTLLVSLGGALALSPGLTIGARAAAPGSPRGRPRSP